MIRFKRFTAGVICQRAAHNNIAHNNIASVWGLYSLDCFLALLSFGCALQVPVCTRPECLEKMEETILHSCTGDALCVYCEWVIYRVDGSR